LIERTLSAPTRAVVLTGPASAGKTQAVIDLYERLSSPASPSRCLILAPGAVAARHLRRRLLEGDIRGGTACSQAVLPGQHDKLHGLRASRATRLPASCRTIVSPRILTFADLSRRILAEATDPDSTPAGTMSTFQRRLLLRSIVDTLTDNGALAGFVKVADTPGLIISLDAAIAELKRAAIEPEQLAPLAADNPAKAALLSVYERYQSALQESRRCDVEGQAWLARDCLARLAEAGQSPAVLADVDLLAVDGFTDLTPTQLEMLSLAATDSRKVLITLPWADDGRSRLWHWTSRTLENIRSRFGDAITHVAVEPPARPALGGLWDRVFDYDAAAADPPNGLTMIAAGGIEQEVAAAAKDIKQLLLHGTLAGQVAVLVRSLDEYGPVIDRVFAECDIPLSPSPTVLTDEPIVRFLLAASSLAPQFSYEQVLTVIGSSYFRPRALGEFDDRSVATARAMILEGNVASSAAAYARAAERFIHLADAPQADSADTEDESLQPAVLLRSADGIRSASDMLSRLFELSSAGDDLPALVDAMQMPQAAAEHHDPQLIARDLRALAALQTALADLPPDTSPQHVREALAAVPCSPARTESLVDVVNVIDARATRYDHVFVLGLSEGQFPRHFSDSALLTEADRRNSTPART
jgi:superfamily I DNA/RNA helicase